MGLLLIAAVGTYALEASLEDAGTPKQVYNESFNASGAADTVLELNNSNISRAYYDENVTVWNDSTTQMDRGTDYEWFVGNGTIKPLSGGDLAGDANATVTYGYTLTTETHQSMATILAQLPRVVGLIAPVFVMVIIFKFMVG